MNEISYGLVYDIQLRKALAVAVRPLMGRSMKNLHRLKQTARK